MLCVVLGLLLLVVALAGVVAVHPCEWWRRWTCLHSRPLGGYCFDCGKKLR